MLVAWWLHKTPRDELLAIPSPRGHVVVDRRSIGAASILRSRSCQSFRSCRTSAARRRLVRRRATRHDTLNEFEHWWKRPVDVLLFFFGLANAGVDLGNAGAGTWFVLIAILIGKPVGILAATALTTLSGLQLPRGVTWRDLTVVGIIAGIGFTVALFFATAAFPYGRLLDETKLGALLSLFGVPHRARRRESAEGRAIRDLHCKIDRVMD